LAELFDDGLAAMNIRKAFGLAWFKSETVFDVATRLRDYCDERTAQNWALRGLWLPAREAANAYLNARMAWKNSDVWTD
jgi:hypothetical protein